MATTVYASGTGVGSGCEMNTNGGYTNLQPTVSQVLQNNGFNNIQSISASSEVTYFIDSGNVYSFGSNGQLGCGNSKDSKIKPEGLSYLSDQKEQKFSKIYSNAHKDNNFCFIQSQDGMLLSFGNSMDFRTGVGSEITQTLPRYVSGFDSPVVMVSLGLCHGVAITERSTLYMWGRPFGFDSEAYPTPFKFDFKFPLPPSGPDDVNNNNNNEGIKQIVSGDEFTLFLTNSGRVFGIGSGESQCLLDEDTKLLEPTLLTFIPEPVKQLACGNSHCLALTQSNRLLVWGRNSNGALGINEVNYSTILKEKVELVNLPDPVIYCAATLYQNFAITSVGDAYSWGYNVFGNLGNGNNRNVIAPQLIESLCIKNLPRSMRISQMTLCQNYSLFLMDNERGEIPTAMGFIDKSLLNSQSTREYPSMPYWIQNSAITPNSLWITGSIYATDNEISDDQMNFKSMKSLDQYQVTSMAIGNKCGYAISSHGNVYCWGSGFALGQGSGGDPCKVPTQIHDLPSGKSVKVFAHASDVCFVTNERGNLYSFGRSKNFLTGQGSDEDDVYYPRLMEGFKSACGIDKVVISSTHALALDKEGNIYAWGSGKALGNRNRSSIEKQPKKIQDQSYRAIDLACGDNYSMYLTDGGRVYSFGEGLKGQLGLGDNKFSSLPTLVKFTEKIVSLASTSCYSSAISQNSNLYFWGNNSNGVLNFIDKPSSKANIMSLSIPTLAPKFTNQHLHHMVLTEINIFAITTRGSLYAWGEPHLGIGSGIKVYQPILVESTQSVCVLDVKVSDWQCLAIVTPKVQKSDYHELPNPQLLESNGTLLSPPNSPNSLIIHDDSGIESQQDNFVDDPEEITRHEDYIKNQTDEVRFWSHLDKEIDINTWCGRIAETKEFLNRLESFKYDPNTEASIQHAQKIIPAGERVLKGWVMYSINHKDYEAERMLIITTENIYRIKYDWKKLQILNYKVFPLTTIYKVKIGKFSDWKSMVSSSLRKSSYEKEYGVQIWFQNPSNWKPPAFVNPFAKNLNYPYITLRPAVNLQSPQAHEDQEMICLEIGTAIQCAIHFKRNFGKPIDLLHKFSRESPSKWNELPPFPVRKVENVQRFGANGLLSYTHNKFIAKTQNGFVDPSLKESNNNNNNNNSNKNK
ncbi:regulator of chromosome condensation domain-containing protein [Tieghemostelium lacteum]|uniref:Regulator of chromosome condensation domain-containing protein n=1 Tax=Tieghemostelium lacteum TaxID=361077 RepID=A0A151ZJ81_TIELA|nr:regulator of chromosome condensation domain-containing protein [Tieghemostelium lacteum]|eukprot:KYQ93977.1 regulator of chromosome condensation domain-containing protein [Tieghemostelium lacteum]